jgi:formylmethanofuran dehydrogenase subunit B
LIGMQLLRIIQFSSRRIQNRQVKQRYIIIPEPTKQTSIMSEPTKETIQEKATRVAEKSWDTTKDTASDAFGKAKGAVTVTGSSAKEEVTDKATSAKESVGGAISNAQKVAEGKTNSALDKVDEFLDSKK